MPTSRADIQMFLDTCFFDPRCSHAITLTIVGGFSKCGRPLSPMQGVRQNCVCSTCIKGKCLVSSIVHPISWYWWDEVRTVNLWWFCCSLAVWVLLLLVLLTDAVRNRHIKNPSRRLPWAIIIVISVTVVQYILLFSFTVKLNNRNVSVAENGGLASWSAGLLKTAFHVVRDMQISMYMVTFFHIASPPRFASWDKWLHIPAVNIKLQPDGNGIVGAMRQCEYVALSDNKLHKAHSTL